MVQRSGKNDRFGSEDLQQHCSQRIQKVDEIDCHGLRMPAATSPMLGLGFGLSGTYLPNIKHQ